MDHAVAGIDVGDADVHLAHVVVVDFAVLGDDRTVGEHLDFLLVPFVSINVISYTSSL